MMLVDQNFLAKCVAILMLHVQFHIFDSIIVIIITVQIQASWVSTQIQSSFPFRLSAQILSSFYCFFFLCLDWKKIVHLCLTHNDICGNKTPSESEFNWSLCLTKLMCSLNLTPSWIRKRWQTPFYNYFQVARRQWRCFSHSRRSQGRPGRWTSPVHSGVGPETLRPQWKSEDITHHTLVQKN